MLVKRSNRVRRLSRDNARSTAPRKTKPKRVAHGSIAPRAINEEKKVAVMSVTTDITERKQMDERLRLQSEIVENMFDGVVLIRASDGLIVYTNQRFEEMFGYGSGELIGKNIATVNAPIDGKSPEGVAQEIEASLREHGVWSGEVQNIKRDGTSFWCRANVSTLESSQYGTVWVTAHEDITERKQAEKALRESEGKYRTLVDVSLEGIMLAQDSPPRIIFANPAFGKMLGYAPDELTSLSPKQIEELVHPDDRARFFGRFRDRLRGKSMSPRFDFRGIRKDGEVGWFAVSSTRIEYRGQPALQGTFVDVTDSRRAEEELRESEERYRSLFDSTLDGIYRSTPEGRFVDVNSAFVRMFRYSSKQEMLDIADIRKELYFAPEERGSHILDTGQEEVDVYRMRRKDGSEIWVEDHGRYVHDDKGKIVFHEGILRDITQRKRSEEAVSRLGAIVEFSNDAIIGKTLEGVITSWNKGAEALYGYSAQEVIGKPVSFLIPPNRPDELAQILEAVKMGEEVQRYETERLGKDGKIIYVSLTISPIKDLNGKIIGASTISRNITERKRAEEERAKYEDRLLALHKHAFELSSATDIDTIANRTLDAIGRTLGFEHTEFMLVENDALRIKANRGDRATYSSQPLNGRGLTVKAANTKTALRIPDTRKEPDYVDPKGYDWTGPPTLLSELIMPVLTNGEVVAVLVVDSTLADAFTADDQRLLETLAIHVGSAIGRLRDEESLKRYSEGLEQLVSERTKKLTESEEHYRLLLESMSEHITVLDTEFRYVLVNDALLRSIKISREQLLGRKLTEVFRGIENSAFFEAGERVMKSRTSTSIETHTFQDGRTSWFEIHIYPVPEGIMYVANDITQRKAAEEQLRVARDQLEYVVSLNPAAIVLAKPLPDGSDLMSIYVSQSSASILGVKPEEMMGESGAALWASRTNPDDLRQYRAKIPLLWKNGFQTFEYRFLHKDGSIRWIHEEEKVIRNSEGKVQDVIGYFTDTTDRKKLEEELHSTKERLENILASNPAVIYSGKPLADLSDWQLNFVSERVASMLGYEPEEFVGHPEFWNSHVHPDDLQANPGVVQALWREGHQTFEYQFMHKDGFYRWMREEARVTRDADGKPKEVNGYWIDITERKQTEKLRDQFISAITHELRTPLVSIKGYVDLALSAGSENLSADVDSNLKVVRRNTDRLLSLVNDLLDIRRMESGKLQLNIQPTDFRQIIANCITETQPLTTAQELTLKPEVPEGELTVLGDEVRLTQVLMNLLANATKFSLQGGQVTLHVERGDEAIKVTVADNGIGIREEDLPRVFQPFAAIQKPTWIRGTGLGLSVSKGIVEAHGGKMWADSAGEGRGATFGFTLPKRREAS